MIQTGDSSVVKATVNQRLDHQSSGDFVLPNAASGGQPLINAGNDCVVKAEISTSHAVSAGGDVVGHKEVHNVHQEVHVQRVSAADAFAKNLDLIFRPLEAEVERIHLELGEARTSNAELFAFVARQTAAIESLSFGSEQEKITQARFSAAIGALETLEHRCTQRPVALARIARARENLTMAFSSQRRSTHRTFLVICCVLMFFILVLVGLAYFKVRL